MKLVNIARSTNPGEAPISSAAFQKTSGNNTATYVITLQSYQNTKPLNGVTSKGIIDALDDMCGTKNGTMGKTTILCLSNEQTSPCTVLAAPIAVSQIATGSQEGFIMGTAVVNQSLYQLQMPFHQENLPKFEKCMFDSFQQAVQTGLSLDNGADTTSAPAAPTSAPVKSASASSKAAPKKSAVVLCALIGVSVLMGTI